MSQCQFPIFCYFCVLEKLHRKYFWNYMRWSPKQRRRGARGQPHHAMAWATPGHARLWCGPLVHPLTSPFRIYILLDEKTLRPKLFSRKHTASRRRRQREIGRVQKLFPAPCRRGESSPEAFFITMPASGVICE
jgi:hypothetical protein